MQTVLKQKYAPTNEFYSLVIESLEDYAILTMDKELIINSWNSASQKIFQYEEDEILGEHFEVIFTEEDRKKGIPIKEIAKVLEEGRATDERWLVRKDNSRFYAFGLIYPLKDIDKNHIGFIKILRNLTERKKTEEAIKKYITEIEEANIDLKTFTYISSHDLQEPLRKIRNFISILLIKEKENLSGKGKIYLEKTADAVKRMQALIDDLLMYSRTKSAERNFEKTDLNIIIDEVKKDLAEVITEKKATIESRLCETKVIRFQFHQLMQNLISNSLKFSKSDVPPHIIIKSEIAQGSELNNEKLSSKTDYFHIVFTDNGIGFDPQYNERIFEVFQRLHSKEEYAGTGMGLAICKRIIENHNGTITATGKPGEGVLFDIYIPAELKIK